MGDITPSEKRDGFVRVGGLVDRTHVTLGIYGEDLDPDEITRLLGCSATRSHRKGDARTRTGRHPPWDKGAWLFTIEGEAPTGPEELLDLLLHDIPPDPAVWERLRARFHVRLYFGIFTCAWNRGFSLSAAAIDRLRNLGCEVGFDIYAEDEEDG